MYAALAFAGAWTTAPPRLPRRTDTRPSVSRIRNASRNDTRLTLKRSTSTSWRGRRSPSTSSPSMICLRSSSAMISAVLRADSRRRTSRPIPCVVIVLAMLQRPNGYSSKLTKIAVIARGGDLGSDERLREEQTASDERLREEQTTSDERLREEQTTSDESTPLTDLRAVEVSDRIAGDYCGKLLVDAGADVVKVEPVGGSPLRAFTATGAVPTAGTDAPLFSYLNAGKRSVTTVSDDLLTRADVVIVTATRSGADRIGIDPRRVLRVAGGCVVVSISDYGWTGPWSERAATEFTLQAASGGTGFRGDPDGPPIAIGGDLGEYMAGAFAAFGALAVHHRVRGGGRGEHLDMSVLEAMTLMQSCEWLHAQLIDVPPISRSIEVPSIEPAKDGYVGITLITGQQWLDFAAMVECPELTEIPPLRFPLGRWEYRDWIRERIGGWFRERTVAEIVELGQLFRLPIAPLGNGATIPDMDYIRERGVFVQNPAGFRQPRTPWLMSAARAAALRDAPALGEADGETLWRRRESVPPRRSNELPLEGVRIVDLTAFWAGPSATHSMAAF